METILQKYIANSGFCSRREAERLIKAGKVKVNGERAEAGQRVDGNDQVIVDGKKIRTVAKTYIKLNKPKGYTCTNRAFEGEKNIFSLVKDKNKLSIVGRLDKDSEGLLILTNDGELTQKLSHPSFGHEKEYEVKVKNLDTSLDVEELLALFKKGFRIKDEEGTYIARVKDIKYFGNSRFNIVLTQGRKRQIRQMFTAFNLEVVSLKRVRIADIHIGNLKSGESRYIRREELSRLKQY